MQMVLEIPEELKGVGDAIKTLNRTTKDWDTRPVTLSEMKGLVARFFAEFILSEAEGPQDPIMRQLRNREVL